MSKVILTGSGVYTPPHSISNDELVSAHRQAVETFNREHASEIEAGAIEERDASSDRWIVRASGIRSRYVLDKEGLLDPKRLRPHLPQRGENEPSIQCEMSMAAIGEALAQAGRDPSDVDAVLVACSSLQRPYPATAIEVLDALGAKGWAYDLNVACSSATFGIQAAVDAVARGHARCAVVVSPEITSAHNNFELRDYHFIFGDACTAVVIEPEEAAHRDAAFEVIGTKLRTQFSNNIRNDFGFLNRCEDGERDPQELLFRQNGRQVAREVCPMVAELILEHLRELSIEASELKRLWLHQANLGMNLLIGKSVLGRDATPEEAPVILDEYANTSSAGSVIAFHRYKDDLAAGDLGVLCSFGAGYSIGSVVLRKLAS